MEKLSVLLDCSQPILSSPCLDKIPMQSFLKNKKHEIFLLSDSLPSIKPKVPNCQENKGVLNQICGLLLC